MKTVFSCPKCKANNWQEDKKFEETFKNGKLKVVDKQVLICKNCSYVLE